MTAKLKRAWLAMAAVKLKAVVDSMATCRLKRSKKYLILIMARLIIQIMASDQ